MSEIRIEGLEKLFDGNVRAVDKVTVTVKEGELVTLLGPSGCGKTTTLRCVAGLERGTGGRIYIGDELVSDGNRLLVPPERRGIGMIFQSYAIWPHMTVMQNVGYGPKIQGRSSDHVKRMTAEAINLVNLNGYEDRFPSQLSGGQQQRVALARALALEPKVLLFDEPLSNLDAKLRTHMRVELRKLQERLGITAIYVTHDQDEAMAISDRVLIMKDGKVVQDGTPREIYFLPKTQFVASFIGEINMIQGVVGKVDSLGARVVTTDGNTFLTSRNEDLSPGQAVTLGIRPEDFRLFPADARIADDNHWPAQIQHETFMGTRVQLEFSVGSISLSMEARDSELPPMNEHRQVTVTVAPDRVLPIKD